MEIVKKKVCDLVPYDTNPRINDDAVNYVAESIRQFGFKVPIVIDTKNTIIAGHTRLKASKLLGIEEVPCIVADDLSDEQVKAFRLADNKVSEQSMWDNTLLQEELNSLTGIDYDMSVFGFELEFGDEDFFVDVDSNSETDTEKEETKRGYSITYELNFNNESEQDDWYKYLSYLRDMYPDVSTISERLICDITDKIGSGDK